MGIVLIGRDFYQQTNAGDCVAELLTSSGAFAVGDVVVWSGTKKVAKAAAAADLTTIAGVALQAATGADQSVQIARRGRALTNCEAGIAAGNLVSSSGGTAGRCAVAAPALGGVLGRATEASGATVASKVEVDLCLG